MVLRSYLKHLKEFFILFPNISKLFDKMRRTRCFEIFHVLDILPQICFSNREILMTASPNIKTPTMDLPLLRTKKAVRKAKKLQTKFNRVILSEVRTINNKPFVCLLSRDRLQGNHWLFVYRQVLQSVDVWESLTAKEHGSRYYTNCWYMHSWFTIRCH